MAKKTRVPTKPRPRSVGNVDKHIGQRIRQLRVQLGMSQAELGLKLGVSFQQIQKYEKGINRVGAGRLPEIARILKTTTSDLLGGDHSQPAPENAYSADLYRMAQEFSELDELSRAPIRALMRYLKGLQVKYAGGS